MTQDELSVMDGGKCILQLRGVRPFLSEKYDITAHPRYKYLSDADKKNEFDIERFLIIKSVRFLITSRFGSIVHINRFFAERFGNLFKSSFLFTSEKYRRQ